MATDRTRWPGRWYRVRFRVARAAADAAAAIALADGGLGTEQRPAGPGRTRISAWFDDEAQARRAAERLAACGLLDGAPEGPVAVEDEGWLAASLVPREPIRAGHVLVCDRAPEQPVAPLVPVILPPGRAFGTGEHPTTRGCLELLEPEDVDGRTVLDLGCGSGILAIAAAALGARRVLALDNDPRVIDVAADNVRLNGAAARVALLAGTWSCLDPSAGFDVLMANVHRTAVVRAASVLGPRLARRRGVAIVSGFAPGELPAVAARWAEAGFAVDRETGDRNWIAVRFRITETTDAR
ncbi:MAG: 50S ribosomal protein L11 methyltransferase [Acidobacteriota bacterium]